VTAVLRQRHSTLKGAAVLLGDYHFGSASKGACFRWLGVAVCVDFAQVADVLLRVSIFPKRATLGVVIFPVRALLTSHAERDTEYQTRHEVTSASYLLMYSTKMILRMLTLARGRTRKFQMNMQNEQKERKKHI
jgi:hypothetical protein